MKTIKDYSANLFLEELEADRSALQQASDSLNEAISGALIAHDLPITKWIKRLEKAQGDTLKLSQIAFARREQLIEYAAFKLTAVYYLKRTTMIREQLKLSIRACFDILEKDFSVKGHTLGHLFSNNIVAALQAYANTEAEKSWGELIQNEANVVPVLELDWALWTALQEMVARVRDDEFRHFPTSDVVYRVYAADPVFSDEQIGATKNDFRLKRQPRAIPLHDFCRSESHVGTVSLKPSVRRVIELITELNELMADVRNKSLAVSQSQSYEVGYAGKLFAAVGDADKFAETVEKQSVSRMQHESHRVALLVHMERIAALRTELAAALKKSFNEIFPLRLQETTFESFIQQKQPIKELSQAAILNCLYADSLLRVSGACLIEEKEVLASEVTQGRSREAVETFLNSVKHTF